MFWMNGCPHCHYVLDNVLPPIQEKYGDQFQIQLVELVTAQDIDRLYQTAEVFGIPKEQVYVPFLVIGEHVLVGSDQIPSELPGLIEFYLAAGGMDYLNLPMLADLFPPSEQVETVDPITTVVNMERPELPTVHLLLFWTPGCHACQVVIDQALPPLKEKYGEQVITEYVDVITKEDVDRFYEVAASFGILEEQADLPMLVIGDHALIGSEQIPEELPDLVEMYMADGGVELPDVTDLVEAASTTDPAPITQSDGFGLAIGIIAFMVLGLIYSIIAFLQGSSPFPNLSPYWLDILFVFLVLAGLGVAGYLAYVETQAVSAVCGPVGDCNAVQSSPYARLFGVLPIGVLGLIGYLIILVGWFYPRLRTDWLARVAPLAVMGMAFFGVLFSLYLTYLEPFVIRAVCAWCLTSAVIMTLLLLLSLDPALRGMEASLEEV
jgi:uncharacterized membrane protein/thiol-disulfide isomerase/thioredoxin/glutaredoxin